MADLLQAVSGVPNACQILPNVSPAASPMQNSFAP